MRRSLTALVLAGLFVSSGLSSFAGSEAEDETNLVAMKIKGVVLDPRTDQPILLLEEVGGKRILPIWINDMAASAIAMEMNHVSTPRPMTHDLIISVIKHINVTITRIEITDLKDGTYFARLVLNRGGEDISIDSRPSDCIALAVRLKCPIYIDESVVNEAGVSVHISGAASDDQKTKVEDKITNLQEKLKVAVDEENYEEAAIIRDKIEELQKNL